MELTLSCQRQGSPNTCTFTPATGAAASRCRSPHSPRTAPSKYARTPARVSCLASVLGQYPARGCDWAKVATDVTQSYLGALEACAESRHMMKSAHSSVRTDA